MKRILIVCILLFWILFPQKILAQDAPKISIIELFSSTHCVYCPAAEDALSKSYNSTNGKFIYVVYHVNDELTGDGVSKRVSYYGIFGTPTAEVDGTYRFLGPSDIKTKGIDRALLNSESISPLSIEFSGISFEQNSITCNVNVNGDVKGNMSLFTILVEDNAKGNQSLTKGYRFVVRSILSTDSITLPFLETFTFSNISSFNPDNLFIVSFIQNTKTMEIYQAEELKLRKENIAPSILNSDQNINSLPLKVYLKGNYGGPFDVQVSRDSEFKTILIDKSFSGNIFDIDKGDLLSGTYYLRAREKNNGYYSEWSGVFQFMLSASKNIVLQVDTPYMYVEGKKTEIDPGRDTAPVIIKEWGRTVLPVRAIVEALNGTVKWDEIKRKVTIEFNSITIELWIDNPKAKINGIESWIDPDNHDVKPLILNSRTMLPLRFVAESLGCTIDWNSTTRIITLDYLD